MGVIFIGDRGVGKSHLLKKLINRQSQRIRVTNLTEEQLELDPSFYRSGDTIPTQSIDTRTIEMQVRLLAPVKLSVDWIDTPGELWRTTWQQANSDEWNKFKTLASKSRGVVIVLPPHRNIGKGINDIEIIDLHKVPNQDQWCNRFERWVNFLLDYCPNVEHIVLCINKADLFCHDIDSEANKLAYNPSGLTMDFVDRNNYIINQYFSPIKSAIAEINQNRHGLVVRCFITSVYNRTLLELPWIYLACYL